MQFAGERFPIHVPDGEDESQQTSSTNPSNASTSSPTPFPGLDFVKDVQERPIAAPRPPTAPTAKSISTGFPEHKKRTGISRFKQARQDKNESTSTTKTPAASEQVSISPIPRNTLDSRDNVKQSIDKENKEKLASMSESEIAQERRDLLQGLPASLVERLLRRANIDEDEQSQDWVVPEKVTGSNTETQPTTSSIEKPEAQPQKPKKSVTFASPSDADNASQSPPRLPSQDSSTNNPAHVLNPSNPSSDDADNTPVPQLPHIHFPSGPEAPHLDPSSASFLTDLHTKYFPTLPSNPSSLSWLDPTISSSSTTTPQIYYTTTTPSIPINALRFSFTGQLLPPGKSLDIPVTLGLHHHGDEPDAAGYTIGELAHLGRSTVAAQRSVAFLTLGRVLFRLGKGEFGSRSKYRGMTRRDRVDEREVHYDDDDDGNKDGDIDQEDDQEEDKGLVKGMDELEKGLWACIKEGRVLETLQQEVNKQGGHVSAKAYAAEALWLWQQGGGKQVRAD